jgi:hypothetical protein
LYVEDNLFILFIFFRYRCRYGTGFVAGKGCKGLGIADLKTIYYFYFCCSAGSGTVYSYGTGFVAG